MLAKKEVVYLNRDNEISLILKQNDSAVDLSGVTDMTLVVGDYLIASSNASSQLIRWNDPTYATGEVRMTLGKSSILKEGYYEATLTLFDISATAGLVWDSNVPIWVRPDPGTT